MDRVKRYLVRQLLHTNGVHLHVARHELWRLVNVEGKTFTEAELKYLSDTLQLLDKVCDRVGKLGRKVQKTL